MGETGNFRMKVEAYCDKESWHKDHRHIRYLLDRIAVPKRSLRHFLGEFTIFQVDETENLSQCHEFKVKN
jgi:hypothetical protein